MPYEHKIERRVEFSETDLAGIVHYSNFFKYVETAEHSFFRTLGHSIVMHDRTPPIGWPRVHVECDYRKPLRFEDVMEVHLLVQEKKSKALTYAFRISRLNGGREEVARGLGIDGAEPVVGHRGVLRLRHRVEERGLADVRQPDDAALDAHGIVISD